MDIRIRPGSADDVASLEPLWKAMVEHHRAVRAGRWPVREAHGAWELRRAQYLSWLAEGSGILLLAQSADPGKTVGYCFCELAEIGPTFDLGERIGDVGSLAVSPEAQGAGVGTALLRACREELTRRGVAYWSISVVEGNERARTLYERVGFRPWVSTLLSPVQAPG